MHVSDFLVVYDYGTGGIWGLANGTSALEITRVLPELTVVNEKPDWMTAEILNETRLKSSFAVADPNSYPEWLRSLVADRDRA